MNAERLHAICKSLQSDFKKTKLQTTLSGTVTALQGLVNASNATTQTAFSTNLNSLYESLRESNYNSYSPSWRQIIKEFNGDINLGDELAQEIKSILSENTITLSIAYEKMSEISSLISTFYEAIKQLASGFDDLGIGQEELKDYECEAGVLIPRKCIDNKLELFIKELKEIDFILNHFTEFVTGKKENLELKTVSSSDLLIYVALAPPSAACLAKAVSWIVNTYKTILEIRKLKMELVNQGVPEKNVKGITDHTNSIMAAEIDKIIVSIEAEYSHPKADKARHNEIKNGLKICLNKIANRIDKGYNFEIRMSLPDVSDEPEDENKPKDTTNEIMIKYHSEIEKSAEILEFIKLEGDSLLSLPEKDKE